MAEPSEESSKSVGVCGGMVNCCGYCGANPPGGGTAAAVEMVGVGGTWEEGDRKR